MSEITTDAIKVGVIGGTGLGALMSDEPVVAQHALDTPFGEPSDAITEIRLDGLPVLFLNRHGPGHLLNPSHIPYRANIFALKQLGVTHILASGAVGSLRDEFRPRELVIPDQIIDKTARRAGSFFDHAAVHVEFAEPFCPILRQILIEAGKASRLPEVGLKSAESGVVHDRGCYVVMEGPAFSTRAESLMHRVWGGDLIGMTAMPEAKLARETEIAYAVVALVTDYDSWRNKPASATANATPVATDAQLLNEIIGNISAAAASATALIRSAITLMSQRREQLLKLPAHSALKQAIWSDKTKISPDEVRRLAPLWIKYFEE